MSKQKEIPGIEREINKRIEDAMTILRDKKKAKTKANSAHKDAEAKAIEIMREEGVPSYTSVDLGLTLNADEKTTVTLSAYHPPNEEKRRDADNEDDDKH